MIYNKSRLEQIDLKDILAGIITHLGIKKLSIYNLNNDLDKLVNWGKTKQ